MQTITRKKKRSHFPPQQVVITAITTSTFATKSAFATPSQQNGTNPLTRTHSDAAQSIGKHCRQLNLQPNKKCNPNTTIP